MSGIGSGRRPSYAGKDTTEDSLPLDIRRLARAGVLSPGRSVGWQWTVSDRVRGSIQIRVEEWAAQLGTIPYEIVCGVSGRVPRIYRDRQ